MLNKSQQKYLMKGKIEQRDRLAMDSKGEEHLNTIDL